MRCCIVGIGKHSSENLIPALKRLQTEGLIKLTHLCREHPEKGDGGLGCLLVSKIISKTKHHYSFFYFIHSIFSLKDLS